MNSNLKIKRSNCRLCSSKNVKLILKMPLSQPVDNYLNYTNMDILLPKFKMDLYQCKNCGHAQLLDVVNPDILYGNYVYKSSSSPDLFNHFKNYSEFLKDYGYITSNTKVLDIGSNDGLFLNFCKKIGAKTFGIDPAAEVSKIAKKNKHKILLDYLNLKSLKKIKKNLSKNFDLITANNVFSHSDDLQSTLNCISNLLNKNGVYIFEVSYLLDTLNNRVIDYIYHEHLSYHSVKPLRLFLKKKNFFIYDIIKVPTKGGSIRVVSGKDKKRENIDLITSFESAEISSGIYERELYKKIQREINLSGELLISWIKKTKKINPKIKFFAYGACATGTVLSSMLGIDKFLNGYIDDNPDKENLLSPNSFLPVLNLKSLKHIKNKIIIILAWRFKDIIFKKIKKLDKLSKVITVNPSTNKISFI
jgi:2-polyprenyl-3-methyl-5-hydroxy-6-metoxy-1,4-benzoquinol methylase